MSGDFDEHEYSDYEEVRIDPPVDYSKLKQRGKKKKKNATDLEPDDGGGEDLDRELAALARNDLGNAERFAERFGNDFIFVDKAGWLNPYSLTPFKKRIKKQTVCPGAPVGSFLRSFAQRRVGAFAFASMVVEIMGDIRDVPEWITLPCSWAYALPRARWVSPDRS